MIPLPIDPYIDDIRASLRRARAAVITASPGAGKTTRVPPALLDAGPVILLQPRRAAARSVARRMADERGWTIGREVGWQVRLDSRYTADTRLLVVTEGILTARLQSDPLLAEFRTVVIDEFHERSLHADVALALSKQAWRARDDLRIVVMSATLEAGPVAGFLNDCPVFAVPGRSFPLEVSYAPGGDVAQRAVDLASAGEGDVLCFMPGAAEIRRTVADISGRVAGQRIEVLPLHGGLDASEQDRVLAPSAEGLTRIVVATNIAETSVTVPGVRHVVDGGLQKVARYDAARAIDSLSTERITQDAADQRAGRAGRTGPGQAVRLWDRRERLRPHREAEIHRIDLAGTALDVLAWGGDPGALDWFEPPRRDALEAALRLLTKLGAVVDRRLTDLGGQMLRLPLHPRLARMLIAARGARPVVQACALLSERQYLPPRTQATTSDLLSAVDAWDSAPPHVVLVARDIARTTTDLFGPGAGRQTIDESAFRRAVLAAYPDRVGRRREPGSRRVKLASGIGAVIAAESGVVDGEFVVAVDVRAPSTALPGAPSAGRQGSAESIVRIASRVEAEWLQGTERLERCWFDEENGEVRAARIDCYDAITLRETPVQPDDQQAAAILADAWLRRGPGAEDAQLLRRLRFAGLSVEPAALVALAARGRRTLRSIRLADALDAVQRRTIERDAPDTLQVPSRRLVRLDYTEDGGVTASVKLQELFGLAETPRIGPRREPVLLALLAPNGRPVQMTRDLRSFWERTYPDVRRELRGRYPRHPWPEDPWTAAPTARTVKRSS